MDSLTWMGQSNLDGQFRDAGDNNPHPLNGWQFGGTSNHPMMPETQDPANGYPFIGRVADLLYRRHGYKCHNWNAAKGGTGLAKDWNGTKIATANFDGVGDLVTSGTTLTASAGLDQFTDGQTIYLRNMGANDGSRVVSGSPSATSLSVTVAFDADDTYATGSVRGAIPAAGATGAGWDPNGYYASARDNGFNLGRFDRRFVCLQFGNDDWTYRQSKNDLNTQISRFIDYWRAQGADGILLGGTMCGTGAPTGTVYSNRPMFMRDAWYEACAELAIAESDVYLGAHIAQAFDWSPSASDYKDGSHFNYETNHVAAEAWYSAIATALGFTPSTAGAFDLDYPRPRIA